MRELDNLLQRALVLVEGSVIEAEHILFEKQPTRSEAPAAQFIAGRFTRPWSAPSAT